MNRVLANYMMWKAASNMVIRLTSEMLDIRMKHLAYKVQCPNSDVPRWMFCMGIVTSSPLSAALSSLYVKRYFNDTTKTAALNITKMIFEEMSRRIQELDWMEAGTR
ncbi:NEDD8 protease nep2 [Homalodisca vitripennis]|nr:NEDD8 protease nep2 [Homalodisca vitripennis]